MLIGTGYCKDKSGNFVDEKAQGRILYQKMLLYSKTKDIDNLRQLAKQDDDLDCGLDVLLEYCSILYKESYSDFYSGLRASENDSLQKKNQEIPDYLPQNCIMLIENCTRCCYGIMLACLDGKKKYLEYPQFAEMEKRIDQLSLEECMQFFLFYNRLSLQYGQQYFFEKWKDGTTLHVVKRMQQLRKNG